MWRIALLLIFSLIVVPIVSFYFDEPPTGVQLSVLKVLLGIYVGFSLFVFILSSLTKNYSQVDKLWSIMPIIYVWVVCWMGNWEPRLLLMAALVSLWGIRLTYNFSRRGGYSWKFWEGEEDYRWSIVKAKPEFQPEWKWTLFNFFFISFYQMGLILWFTLPILKSMEGRSLQISDYILSAVMLLLIFLEWKADQEQWDFQTEKYRRINNKEALSEAHKKGFLDAGLWGIVRHPNYAAEQAIWIVFYFFSVVATGNWINWSAVGCLLLILLFKGSSDLSESISTEKYPSYSDYQKRVPRFIPFLK